MKIKYNLLLILFTLFIFNKNLFAVEDNLLGVQLGCTVQELYKKYPKIYAHKLMLGEVLYESCNQNKLEVITFTENPWSKSFITFIMLRQESDKTVCRDETGALPDFNITIITPKGIKLGDTKEKIISKYGKPNNTRKVRKDWTVMTYAGKGEIVEDLKLIFVLNDKNVVTDISLMGNMPGTHPPRMRKN